MTRLPLISVAVAAPIVGATKADRHTLHHVSLEAIVAQVEVWATATSVTATCGVDVKIVTGGGGPVRWRDIRTRGTGYQRCPDCRAVLADQLDARRLERAARKATP